MSELVFRLPDVGEGLTEAEIIEWLIAVGSEVRADQPVVTVETAKAQVELPAPADGVVQQLSHQAGDVVEVGAALFVLDTAGDEPAAAHDVASEHQPAEGTSAASTSATASGAHSANGRRRVLAAPSTRRLAVEHGVDLSDITGSGPAGRIVLSDVEQAIDTQHTPTSTTTTTAAGSDSEESSAAQPLRGLRRQVAEAMTAAWSAPHITEFREVDATALEHAHDLLRDQARRRGERLTLLPLLVRIVVAALRQHPDLNATFDVDAVTVEVHPRLNLGIATATPDGLIVPVVQDAADHTVRELGREITRLAEAARQRTLTVEDTTGGTFTISNFGSYGTWLGTPLINAPQVGITGFGRVHEAVVPVAGAPAVRRVLPLAVAADHRLIDGAALGAFVGTLEQLIQEPLLLLGTEV